MCILFWPPFFFCLDADADADADANADADADADADVAYCCTAPRGLVFCLSLSLFYIAVADDADVWHTYSSTEPLCGATRAELNNGDIMP